MPHSAMLMLQWIGPSAGFSPRYRREQTSSCFRPPVWRVARLALICYPECFRRYCRIKLSKARRVKRPADSLWRLRAALPTGLRAWVARVLPNRLTLELTARLEMRGVDWTKTSAFMVPSGDCGYIRLNLRGRERDGIVSPEEVGRVSWSEL